MKKNCTVRLTDTQIEEEKKQSMEITTQGVFFWNDGRFLLRFEEFFDEDILYLLLDFCVSHCAVPCCASTWSAKVLTE